MPDIKILFLHGMEGTPEGTKPTFLQSHGYRVVAPALPKGDWNLSVRRAENCFINFRPNIIVGSSRGGAVAAAFPVGKIPKILIAPACNKFGVTTPFIDETTTILHSTHDELIDFSNSVNLVENYGCELIDCGAGHRMSDPDALQSLLRIVKNLKMGKQ